MDVGRPPDSWAIVRKIERLSVMPMSRRTTCARHGQRSMDYSLIWRRRADDPTRKSEIPAKPLKEMVGATGIEPVTPTMSR
jgi:hypothetical protein